MANLSDSDSAILDLLRRRESASVSELEGLLGVTATAVRQRLNRLQGAGLIERKKSPNEGRGRPGHQYSLTETGRQHTGANFADLAVALWQEVRQLKDPAIRRGLLKRLSERLAEQYRGRVDHEDELVDRMRAVAKLFEEREIPLEVKTSADAGAPALNVLACPYPTLAELDRTVCSMEKMLMSELLGENVSLSRCRLDGETCCTFEVN